MNKDINLNKIEEIQDNEKNNDEDNEEDNEEDEEIMSEEEIDDETRRLTMEAYNRYIKKLQEDTKTTDNNLTEPKSTKSIIKKQKNKQHNKLSLTDFFTNVNIVENKKSKLFISKRVEDKRNKNIVLKEIKRAFNPRIPPYNFIEHFHNFKETKLNDTDFPTLGGK